MYNMPLSPDDKYESFVEVKRDDNNNDIVAIIITAYTVTIAAIIHHVDGGT